jgi:hypothetical protein
MESTSSAPSWLSIWPASSGSTHLLTSQRWPKLRQNVPQLTIFYQRPNSAEADLAAQFPPYLGEIPAVADRQ